MTSKTKSIVNSVKNVAESAIKYGVEVATSHDPLRAAIEVGGKTGVGVSLSRFSASQCAGLVGVIVTSITPQVINIHNKCRQKIYFEGIRSSINEKDK
jgi:hypothetical protein